MSRSGLSRGGGGRQAKCGSAGQMFGTLESFADGSTRTHFIAMVRLPEIAAPEPTSKACRPYPESFPVRPLPSCDMANEVYENGTYVHFDARQEACRLPAHGTRQESATLHWTVSFRLGAQELAW
jgi:hypothetical protein